MTEPPQTGPQHPPADGTVDAASARGRSERRLLYFADPMCSWCWGFHPAIEALARNLAGEVAVSVLLGGLRPGTREPLAAEAKAEIGAHWRKVEQVTGQPFDLAFFDRQDFVYDTEPACRAVVAMRSVAPELALGFLGHLQRAFYQLNTDITRADKLIELAEDWLARRTAPAGTVDFGAQFESQEVVERTGNDFALAQELGVRGFPALVGYSREGLVSLVSGYVPAARLEDIVSEWLAQVAP